MTHANSVLNNQSSNPDDDPVVGVRRDHTFLEMLAEGFRHMAQNLAEGKPVDLARIREGIDIHRIFLLETHHRKEQLLDDAVARLPGTRHAAALAECERQHAEGAKAAEVFEREFERLKAGDKAGRKRLAEALEHEADRWMHHMHHEEEQLYAHLRLPEVVATPVATGMRQIQSKAGAIEERLTSWTSSWGQSSD